VSALCTLVAQARTGRRMESFMAGLVWGLGERGRAVKLW
jgi:hypothetical protein